MNKSINHNTTLEGFSSLPYEISSIILSKVDLQTLFNTAYSFAGNSYEVGNEFVKSILEKKFVKVKNDKSYLRQYFDYLIKSRDLLSIIYESIPTSKDALFDLELIKTNMHLLEDDLKEFDEKIKKNPRAISSKSHAILTQIPHTSSVPEQEIELRLLIEKGAKISLDTCLAKAPNESLLEQILNQKAFNDDTIGLYHVTLALPRYSEKITSGIVSLVTRGKINFDYNTPKGEFDAFRAPGIISSNLSDSIKISLIDKFSSINIRVVNDLLRLDCPLSTPLSEALVDKILDKAAPFLCESDERQLQLLANSLQKKIFIEKRYSFNVLIKLIKLYTKAKIQFDLEKYEQNILQIDKQDFYKNEQWISSLVQNQANFSLKFLARAVRNRVSPELIFKAYKVFFESVQKNEHKLTHTRVLNYMFNSKNYKVIEGLNELECPGWNTIENAIRNKDGETLISLLLDGYEMEEKRREEICQYPYNTYSHFLAEAVEHNLSESLIKRILNKTTVVFDSTFKKAKEHLLSGDLIQTMEQKLRLKKS